MNLVQRWFCELTTKNLQRSPHRTGRHLADEINAWTAAWNSDPKPYRSVKTADCRRHLRLHDHISSASL